MTKPFLAILIHLFDIVAQSPNFEEITTWGRLNDVVKSFTKTFRTLNVKKSLEKNTFPVSVNLYFMTDYISYISAD